MRSKSTVFGAALAAAGVLNGGAQAAVNVSGVDDPMSAVAMNVTPDGLSRDGVSVGARKHLTIGVEVGDTYVFRDIGGGGGISEALFHDDLGVLQFRGPPSRPTFLTGVSIEDKAENVNINAVKVAPIPELATWAMFLAGFVGLGLAGCVHKDHARLPE